MLAFLPIALCIGATPVETAVVVRVAGDNVEASTLQTIISSGVRRATRQFPILALLVDEGVQAFQNKVRDCGADNNCVMRVQEQVGVGLTIYVVGNVDMQPSLLTFEVLGGPSKSQVRRVAELGGEHDDDVVVENLTRALIEAGFSLGGRLTVEFDPADAVVTLDGAGPVASGVARVVLPGTLQLLARRDGYKDFVQQLDIHAGHDEFIKVRLERAQSLTSRWWFWTGLGLLAAGAATGIVVASTTRGAEVCHPVKNAVCP